MGVVRGEYGMDLMKLHDRGKGPPRNERQTEVSGLFNKRSAGVRSVGRKGLSFSLPRRPRHYGDEHQQSSHSEMQLTAG